MRNLRAGTRHEKVRIPALLGDALVGLCAAALVAGAALVSAASPSLHSAGTPPIVATSAVFAATCFRGLRAGVFAAIACAVAGVLIVGPLRPRTAGSETTLWLLQAGLLLGAAMIAGVMRRRNTALGASYGQALESLRKHEGAHIALQRLRGILDVIPQRVFWKDLSGRYEGCNAAFARDAGFSSTADVVGRTDDDMPWSANRAKYRADDMAVCTSGKARLGYIEFQDTEGANVRRLRTSKLPLHGLAGDVVGVLGVYEDVTREHAVETELRVAANVQKHAVHGVMVVDLLRRIVSVNPSFTRITGYSEADVVGRTPAMLRSKRHPGRFYDWIWWAASELGVWEGDVWWVGADGSDRLMHATASVVRDDTSAPTHFTVSFTDVTAARADADRLRILAQCDALTGLPNAVAFRDAVQACAAACTEVDSARCLLLVDIDGFRTVNDAFGHDVGDELLQQVGRRLQQAAGDRLFVARLDGDNFGLLGRSCDDSTPTMLASLLLGAFAKPFQVAGHEIPLSASMGVVAWEGVELDHEQALRRANVAVRGAKARGKSQFQVFDRKLDDDELRSRQIAVQLRDALERGQMTLAYQPQISFADGVIVGFEALLRWTSDALGPVSPADFIPHAERSGHIHLIGKWVLETACREAVRWKRAAHRPVRVAVNISPQQLLHPEFIAQVREVLASTHLEPGQLEVEITEGVVIGDADVAAGRLRELRGLGVLVSLDDFGTGYSSLSYLKTLPLDVIKIDRAFVDGLPGDSNDAYLTATIIQIARKLGLKVVAEGVERESQRTFLSELGCDLFQGYLASRPVPAASALSLLLTPIAALPWQSAPPAEGSPQALA